MLGGEISKGWAEFLNEEVISSGGQKDERISVKLIRGLTTFAVNLWRARCEQVFWGSKKDRLKNTCIRYQPTVLLLCNQCMYISDLVERVNQLIGKGWGHVQTPLSYCKQFVTPTTKGDA